MSNTKWVSCWGTATSITDRKPSTYSKSLTLRYPVKMFFTGSDIRIRLSNETGTEPVRIDKIKISKCDGMTGVLTSESADITFGGKAEVTIGPAEETVSDSIAFPVRRGEFIAVSMYMRDFTQMNSATRLTGPLSKGYYAYGDFCEAEALPVSLSRETQWYWFLNTIDILTDEKNHAVICYGDSITAQSWPDYLALRCFDENFTDIAIIRRAVSGTRILREYDCITYLAYGKKGANRFEREMNTFGATDVIIQHGINDIIHPVGTDVNIFRPWSDLPTCEEMIRGVSEIYLDSVDKLKLGAWSATLLPIFGWRTYADFREKLKNEFNEWLRSSDRFKGCIDFDAALRDPDKPEAFRNGYDSGDHLHPSEAAYKKMAETVPLDKF